MKTVVILQSNYIPWKGYFDLMHEADEFVLYDDRQYTRQDWRNRNQIKASSVPQWLTIPIVARFGQRIDETMIADPRWADKHWKSIRQAYRKAPHFTYCADRIEAMYCAARERAFLSEVNVMFLEGIARLLGFEARLRWSTEFPDEDTKTRRLVSICASLNATRYISGPAARDYIEPEMFAQAGIELSYKSYEGYPEYSQMQPPFMHGVTVLDLLFNTGPDAPWYIWGWRDGPLIPRSPQD